MLIFRSPIDEKISIAQESLRVTNSHDDSSPIFGIRNETAEERRISKRSKFLRPMANIRKLETKPPKFSRSESRAFDVSTLDEIQNRSRRPKVDRESSNASVIARFRVIDARQGRKKTCDEATGFSGQKDTRASYNFESSWKHRESKWHGRGVSGARFRADQFP